MRSDRFNWSDFCRHMVAIRDAGKEASVYELVACPRALHSEAERLIRFLGIEDNVELVIAESRRRSVRQSTAHHIS